MKIIKIGTSDKQGFPINWHIDGIDMKEGSTIVVDKHEPEYCLGIIKEKVYVNGIEIVEWTEKRQKIMNELT